MPTASVTVPDLIDRPGRGVQPDPSTPSISAERREALLRDALRLKIPLPLLLKAGDDQGQAVLVYRPGDEIIMDARMPIQVLRDVPEGERLGDWVMGTDASAWTALRFTVTGDSPRPGCGKGYLGLGWTVSELTDHLLSRLSNVDFVCLATQVGLMTLREDRRAAHARRLLGPLAPQANVGAP